MDISKNGKTFVLSSNYKVIGLQKEDFITNIDSIKKYILKDYTQVNSEAMVLAIENWHKLSENKDEPFSFKLDNQKWWARVSEYKLGINNHFIIGVVVPENDFVHEVHKTRNVVIGGFAIIILFIVFIFRQNNIRRKTNIVLTTQKDEIQQQNEEINQQNEEIQRQHNIVLKQKQEITDSIVYAERIQRVLLPQEEIFDELFEDHFILYRPLHIVSGDFYWVKKVNQHVIIAAADCTGHGVPGAFMSMLGISFLNEICSKEKITKASDILTELRKMIKTSLKQTKDVGGSKDGMDMAIYSINMDNYSMQYAGAYNPAYIIRNNEMKIIKADRQPIAVHIKEKDFINHTFQLQKSDIIYTFSDGYADEFGGEEGKKFKIKNFKKLLLDIHKKSLKEQHDILDDTITNWLRGYQQIDDILVIGVKI